jgi:hypothetical protein
MSAPRQHTRWDFMYAGDNIQRDGLSMIWPEFLSANGDVLPEGEVPLEGNADMFIFAEERVPYHMSRIRIGTKGHFMEGPNRIADCEVIAVNAALPGSDLTGV